MGSVAPFEEILSRICILLKMIGEEWNIAVADMQKHVANIVIVLYVGCYWRKQSTVYDSFHLFNLIHVCHGPSKASGLSSSAAFVWTATIDIMAVLGKNFQR
ncbi:unnamed protein product [Musa acuminata subsp. burmannicoides]